MMDRKNPAVVLSMTETGLGVARSLGKGNVVVLGFDFKKDIAFYSKYVKAQLCPHPLEEEGSFINFMMDFGRSSNEKPVIFITSDDFLLPISKNREKLEPHFLFNLPSEKLIRKIIDKYSQYELAQKVKVDAPATFLIEGIDHLDELQKVLPYPVLVKPLDVNVWRKKISSIIKGMRVNDADELLLKSKPILDRGVKLIVQEIIQGPDTSHYKYCAYYSPDGKPVLEFTLRKIRQNPIHFGVGAVVESVRNDELMQVGTRLFKAIGYQGVGSAEFKRDEKDHKLKLIEINPRYWQQNYLPTACGMNFPLVDYLTVRGKQPAPASHFRPGIKWVNRYLDTDSFLKYRKEKTITFWKWRRSLRGRKVYSDFAWDDPLPALYMLGFGRRLFRIPGYLLKRLFALCGLRN
jgi:D-aspartate ligase